ncbi:MAG: FAD-binding protein [Chloroflexi bacterium]|nr:FAD-binding protein [Chloroflexota bacterium]
MAEPIQPITWTNWVGNQSFSPRAIIDVASEAEVQAHVAAAAANGYGVRTFGARHSFTPIIETNGILLNLEKLKGVTHIDPQNQLVTALPMTTVGEFGDPLWAQGLALTNQGDIDTQAIAGAIATATHGPLANTWPTLRRPRRGTHRRWSGSHLRDYPQIHPR